MSSFKKIVFVQKGEKANLPVEGNLHQFCDQVASDDGFLLTNSVGQLYFVKVKHLSAARMSGAVVIEQE